MTSRHQRQRLLHAVFQPFGVGQITGVVGLAQRQVAAGEKSFQLGAQLQLVAQRKLDVDALDAQGVLAHARQRDHHVFVDLEGVGVLADRGGALAVEPEFLARFRADGHKAFAAARVGHANHFAGGAGHRVGVVAHDVADQHHLGQAVAARVALALGGVAHRFQIAVVQVFQTGQQRARALLLGEHEVLDVDDAGHAVFRVAEKLQADGAHVLGHAVHDPAPAGDQAVAAFFLNARQAAQELVGHVLAQAFLAEGLARNHQLLGAHMRFAVGFEGFQLKGGDLGIVDLAQVVVHARDFQPLRLRRHHAPGNQVVQRRAPQNGLLAARVHGDVATDARSFGAGRVHGEHMARALGRIGHALGDHAGFRPHRGQAACRGRAPAPTPLRSWLRAFRC